MKKQKNFTIPRCGMISGQGEVAERIWRCAPCKNDPRRRWFWPINDPEPGAHVHFDPNDPHSEGYAGATLDFHMETGEIIKVKGPWHGNTDSMFADTGVDLRDKHLTFVVLSKDRTMDANYNTVMVDVVYMDKAPTLGRFNRVEDLIAQHPEARYYYSQSHGGSSSGPCNSNPR